MEKGEETIYFSRAGLGRRKKAERKEEEKKRGREGREMASVKREREGGRRERNNYVLLNSGSWEEKVVVDCRYILTGEEREASETGGGRAEAAVDTFPSNLKLEAKYSWHCIFAHYFI